MVFGADTGVCVRGSVILRHDVIADHWVTVSLSFICLAAFFGFVTILVLHFCRYYYNNNNSSK